MSCQAKEIARRAVRRSSCCAVVLLSLVAARSRTRAEESPATAMSPTSAPTTQPADAQPTTVPRKHYTTKAISATLAPDPPAYVRRASQLAEWFGIEDAEKLNWLDIGIEHNTRYEHRRNYYPAGNMSDNRFLMRSRAYLGIREIADPLRLGFEFQDARAFGNDFPEITQDVDEHEIQQAFAELHFKDAIDTGHPLALRAGRMSFDMVNRRLVARNGFRNSTNAFDGFRLRAGDETTPWEINVVAMKPVERFARQLDQPDDERWLYGITGDFRGLDPGITFKPYYFVLDDDRKGFNKYDRELHTVGLNVFGLLGDSGFDYDLDGAWQFGKSRRRNHRAFATHAQLGYTFKHEWKPRLAGFFDYATGDRHPFDRTNERFDRLFGASHMFYAPSDMFIRENLIQPGMRLTLNPLKNLTLDGFYRAYWLASDSDTWAPGTLRDRYGRSGDFIGHGFDVVAIYRLSRQVTIEIGYAHLTAGEFIRNTTPFADDADFFYVQTTLRL